MTLLSYQTACLVTGTHKLSNSLLSQEHSKAVKQLVSQMTLLKLAAFSKEFYLFEVLQLACLRLITF